MDNNRDTGGRRPRLYVASLLACLGALAAPVSADDLEADIDEFAAGWFVDGGDIVVKVAYEVEVEADDRRPPEMGIVLRLYDGRRRVRTADGVPWETIVPLDRVKEADDDGEEVTFADALTVRIPRELIRRPDRLVMRVAVVAPGWRKPLDHDTAHVRRLAPPGLRVYRDHEFRPDDDRRLRHLRFGAEWEWDDD